MAFTRTIDIDNTGGSAQTNFPVQVDLTSANFNFAEIDSEGTNVRFELQDTTVLDHWRESFDNPGQTATFWVEIPSLGVEVLTINMIHNTPPVSDTSDGDATFTFFDDFVNTKKGHFPYGADSGMSAAYDPVSRRIYWFGVDADSANNGPNVVQWYDIVTGEIGYVHPGLDTKLSQTLAVYNANEQKIFLYGGRLEGGARTNKIQSFDPATGAFATLTETLPDSVSGLSGAVYPTNGKVFLFGGYTGTAWKDYILVHDIGAGTVTDTTANIPTASNHHTAVWVSSESRMFIFGGVTSSTSNLDTIWKYDPGNESTDPVAMTSTLAAPSENQGVADVSGNVYIFGGVDRAPAPDLYQDDIQKFIPATDSISTLTAVMPRKDDDQIAVYDSTNARIYIGPTLHSSQTTDNTADEKFIVNVFDPALETMAAEPTIGDTPVGWANVGSSTKDKMRAVNATFAVFADRETGAYSRGEEGIAAITSGDYMYEVRINVPYNDNIQCHLRHDSAAKTIGVLTPMDSADWKLRHNTGNQVIAAVSSGFHIIGMLMDIGAQNIWGLLDRANKTAQFTFFHTAATQVDELWCNTSTAGRDAAVIDWIIIRKSTTGTGPVVTVNESTGPDLPLLDDGMLYGGFLSMSGGLG